MKKISYSAGHGINTPGKRSPNGIREWEFNNKVALGFEQEMLKYDNVELLRLDDRTGQKDISLTQRVNLSNNFKADVHIDLHHNALHGKWGSHTGTEIFIFPNSVEGRKLANIVLPKIVAVYGLKNRGIKQENFQILRETKCPAILIEGGFMDSTIDIKKLADDYVLYKAGNEIAKGVAEYLKLKPIAPNLNNPSSWAKESWDWGKKEGLTDGKFPQNYATRQQVIEMLYRYNKKN